MSLIWQIVAWSRSTMNIATFRQTGVCWPDLMSHFFWCRELYYSSRLECYIQLHIQTSKCGFHNTCSIYYYYCICTSSILLYIHIFYISHLRRLDRCLNGHMTTGIMNFYYSCLSHQATLSAAVLCVFSYQDLYPFIHILGAASTSDVVNAISASFLTSLSENTSCCTHFCLTVPSLSFISVKLALPLDWALPSLALALSAPTPQHYNCHAPFTYVDLPTQEGVPLWVSLG